MNQARKALCALGHNDRAVPEKLKPAWIECRDIDGRGTVYVYADGSLLYMPLIGPRIAYPHEPEELPQEVAYE